MSYLNEPKDPSEIITVGFDFKAITDTPSNPTISTSIRWGHGHHHTVLAPVGDPWIEGHTVYQRFLGGTDMHDYNLKCLANTPAGDKYAVDCVVAVRTRPV